VRWWAGEQLDQALLPNQAALARALLLGDQSAFVGGQFLGYQRTGVYHILAISGQHLAILSLLLWPALRVLPLPRSQRALLLAMAVLFYALLTGGRPPILRAAVMVGAFCGGMVLRRQVQPINSLALAWLLVAILNPADMFQTGCQISFLCVLVLLVVVWPLEKHWTTRDPLNVVVDKARPYWQQLLAALGRWCLWAFIAGAVLWLIVTPLTAARYHLVSPAAILLGPPLVVLSSLALIAGFLFLLLTPFGATVTWPFAVLMQLGLDGCEQLVQLGEQMPLAYWYTPGPPEWWLVVFYGGLLLWITMPALRSQWRLGFILGIGWACVLFLLPSQRLEPGELRCTVLAVGHGSCAVLELPDGRVLLYDAGSIAGPEVAVRQIAPFLWDRGITRLDEVYVSHADLDHFNGLPALMERFAVAQVSITPTFFAKDERGIHRVADELTARRIPLRVLSAGQQLDAGGVAIQVLHPPAQGPEGTENARSLVLLIRYAGKTLLLTGDLEEPGLSMVLDQRPPSVDVLLAPHHGSAASNTERFAAWARPKLVISSEGREPGRRVDPYTQQGALLWRTSREGAVRIRILPSGIEAETFRTKHRWLENR
jgi:competence protein ComEC